MHKKFSGREEGNLAINGTHIWAYSGRIVVNSGGMCSSSDEEHYSALTSGARIRNSLVETVL